MARSLKSIVGGGRVSAVHRSQGSSVALVERMVLATFASSATLTRLELEELTGLSRTVVAGVVASLVARGELAELRQPPTAGTGAVRRAGTRELPSCRPYC